MSQESESASKAPHWELWRQDDNGVRVLVARFEDREAAHEALIRFELKRHKQTYWLEEKKSGQAGFIRQ
jgi:hypothetical protein